MSDNVILSKGDLLNLIRSIDFDYGGNDLNPEDIAEEVEVYAEGTE